MRHHHHHGFGFGPGGPGRGFRPGPDDGVGPDGPRGFGPGFGRGFGPGFGGPGFGGRGRGGPGGRARRGDVRHAVLALLAENPSNGYGLIGAISERTDGAWTPSPGSIYPTLAQLVDEGLVVQTGGPRGPYELTDAGREHVAGHEEQIRAAFEAARASTGEGERELFGAVRKLVTALGSFRGGATKEQLDAAVVAVDTARRELHRILAE